MPDDKISPELEAALVDVVKDATLKLLKDSNFRESVENKEPGVVGRVFTEFDEMLRHDKGLCERLGVEDITAGDPEWIAKVKEQGWDGVPRAFDIGRLQEVFDQCMVDGFRERIIAGDLGGRSELLDVIEIAHRGKRYLPAHGINSETGLKEEVVSEPKDIFGDIELNIPTLAEIDEQFQRELGEEFEAIKAGKNGTIAICPTGHEPFCKKMEDDGKRGPFFEALQKGYKPPEDFEFPHSMPHEVKGVNLKSSRGMTNEFAHLDDPAYQNTKDIGRGLVNPSVKYDHVDEEAWNPHDAINQEDPEHVEWLRKKAIREEYETVPLLRDRDDIVALAEQVLGRFLGACRVQAPKVPGLNDLDRVEPLFDQEIDGMLVQITPRPLTRHMQVCIEKIGFINICLDKDWVYPGTYEEQLERFTNEMIKMHLEVQFEHTITMTHLATILAKRDKVGMECLFPPGISFRFKGNKGVFFSHGEKEVYYKDYSIHQHQDKVELYKDLREFMVGYMLDTKISVDAPVDYHKSRPYLGPARRRDPHEPQRG